ncbi:hypothetical protein L7F22_019608 [Adiantum nelumboides]|nr:hypothetical protein [Adiantum nelumboides]
MENDRGDLVDLYVPRKCAATGRLIEAKDHSSVQISVANVDENGRMINGSSVHFPLSGFVRAQGEGDDSLNRLATKEGCKYSEDCCMIREEKDGRVLEKLNCANKQNST